MTDGDLAGVGVLVTRPANQAAPLVDAIEAEGGKAVRFPAIEVVPRAEADIASDARSLQQPDIAIFVSVNAVRFGLEHADSASVAVIGPATAAAIEAAGKTVDIRSAAGFDSMQLLAEPQLHDVSGKVVRIIRGNAGRELLATTLRARGATVEYLPVYSRQAPQPEPEELDALERQWRAGGIDVVTIMSVETLTNLVSILPAGCQDLLRETPLVTPAERVIIEADERFPGISAELAEGTGAHDIVRAIARCAPGHS